MTTPSDRDLERRFAAMRAADERHAPPPPLRKVLAGRSAVTRRPKLGLALAVALGVVALLAVWRLRLPNEPALVVAFTPGDMRVPTDYLLDIVTSPRAGEVPRLGAATWFPLSMTDSDSRRQP